MNKSEEQLLKEVGITDSDTLFEECVRVIKKKSKLSARMRRIVVQVSFRAYKELKTVAEDIKKESLESKKETEDGQEQQSRVDD